MKFSIFIITSLRCSFVYALFLAVIYPYPGGTAVRWGSGTVAMTVNAVRAGEAADGMEEQLLQLTFAVQCSPMLLMMGQHNATVSTLCYTRSKPY